MLLVLGGTLLLTDGIAQYGSNTDNGMHADTAVTPPDLSPPPKLTTIGDPTLTSVAPAYGINNAASNITITGSNFRTGSTITVDCR